MNLENKTVVIMGIRNKWSIAWGAAMEAHKNGAKNIVFTYNPTDGGEKLLELISEIPGSKAFPCDASSDESIKEAMQSIKNEYGKVDCILHSIAHAFTNDLRDDFIFTSREGFAHANDISAYSFVAVARIADELELLNENASLVSLTYHGSTKVLPGYNVMGVAKAALDLPGYNVMGVAKAALETSVRYLAYNLGQKGIRVNAVSAGPIKTLSSKGIKDFGSILHVVEEKAPLKRNVSKEEVGDVVAFLFSDMSSSITGQIIYADCGYSIMGI